jgi:hypothetical protein
MRRHLRRRHPHRHASHVAIRQSNAPSARMRSRRSLWIRQRARCVRAALDAMAVLLGSTSMPSDRLQASCAPIQTSQAISGRPWPPSGSGHACTINQPKLSERFFDLSQRAHVIEESQIGSAIPAFFLH